MTKLPSPAFLRCRIELKLNEERASSLSNIDGLENCIHLLKKKLAQSQEEALMRLHELEHVKVELKHTLSKMENEEQAVGYFASASFAVTCNK